MLPRPFWGLSELTWDEVQLKAGRLCLTSLSLRLQSGEIIDFPSNAAPPPNATAGSAAAGKRGVPVGPRRIELSLKDDGHQVVSVYLHWRGDHRFRELDRDGGELSVPHLVRSIVLSSNPTPDGVNGVFKLGEFEADAKGHWAQVPTFLPALLNVTGSPFFEPFLQRAKSLAGTLRKRLEDTIRAQYLAMYTKLSAQQCLRVVYEFEAFIANVAPNIVKPHPEQVFSALRNVYIATCVYHEQPPGAYTLPYAHERAGDVFCALLDAFEAVVDRANPAADYAQFLEEDGVRVCVLPEAALEAESLYWLVERTHTADSFDPTGIKLAAASRLRTVHQRALPGIRYQARETPFRHHFSERILFYRLDAESEEWQHARSEGQVVFYARPEIEGRRCFLHWQRDKSAP